MAENIPQEVKNRINSFKDGLKSYPIRDLVQDAERLGPYLKQQRLETNQVRKFLDAINQIKAKVSQDDEKIQEIQKQIELEKERLKHSLKDSKEIDEKSKYIQSEADSQINKLIFAKIETDIVLLKPKLAYAAARQRAVKPLSDIMSAAIDRVYSKEDFDRLVQLVESIIAYHKGEGGR